MAVRYHWGSVGKQPSSGPTGAVTSRRRIEFSVPRRRVLRPRRTRRRPRPGHVRRAPARSPLVAVLQGVARNRPPAAPVGHRRCPVSACRSYRTVPRPRSDDARAAMTSCTRRECDRRRRGTPPAVMVRIGEIVFDSGDSEQAAAFWCGALGYQVLDRDAAGVAIAGDERMPTLLFLRSDEPKQLKNRIHIDVCPVAGSDRDEEVERLERLGATRVDVGRPYDRAGPSWRTPTATNSACCRRSSRPNPTRSRGRRE